METVMFVEVLDRKGHVRERVALSTLPAEIGRAYTNAVVLDDPYVSPQHVRVYLDEKGLWLEDLDSANGLIVHPGDDLVKRSAVVSGSSFRLGNTLIRLVEPQHPVPAALKQWVWVRRFERLLGSSRFQVAVVVGALADILLHRYFATSRKVEWGEVAADELSSLLAFCVVYLGFWSTIATMFTGQPRVRRNAAVLGLVVVVTSLWRLVAHFLEFGLDLDFAGELSGFLEGFVLMGLGLYGHVRTSTDARPVRSLAVALVLAGCITAGVGMKEYKERKEFSNYPRFSGQMMPPAFRLARAAELDSFLAGAAPARERADREAKDQ